MARKTAAVLKAEIAAFTALHSEASYKAILTDIVDSSVGLSDFYMYTYVMDRDLAAGTETIEHSYDIVILKVFIPEPSGTEVYEPSFENASRDSVDVTWVGATLTTPTLYFLAIK